MYMKTGAKLSIEFLLILAIFFALPANADPSGLNPHLVSKSVSRDACKQCHIQTPELNHEGLLNTIYRPFDPSAFKQDSVSICLSCHRIQQGHKVGIYCDFPVPADLPLNAQNQIICVTCHYMHGSPSSDKPMANFSFMDKLFNAERLRKSYYLRRNNGDGELCLVCHKVN